MASYIDIKNQKKLVNSHNITIGGEHKELLAMAIIAGGSGNVLRQIGVTNIDWDQIKDLQRKYRDLQYDLLKQLDFSNVNDKNYKFN